MSKGFCSPLELRRQPLRAVGPQASVIGRPHCQTCLPNFLLAKAAGLTVTEIQQCGYSLSLLSNP